MKNIFRSHIAKIILLFISFVLTTFILGGLLLNGLLRIPSEIANVIVIAVILLITWLAYKKEGKDLSELGLDIRWRNFYFGLIGILIGGLFVIPLVYTIAYLKGYPVVFNPNFSASYVLSGLWLMFPTVMLEELAFRGICFKKTVERTGVRKANIIFGMLFILSHWINLGAFGNPVLMILLLITGLGHVLYATALLRSKTLYFPIGLHLGNNWVSFFVFSNMDVTGKAGEVKPSLVRVFNDGNIPVFNGQFILTTIVTAILFIIFIFTIGRLTYPRP